MKSSRRLYHIARQGFEAARRTPEQGLHGHSFKISALGLPSVHASLVGVVSEVDYTELNTNCEDCSDVALAERCFSALDDATELRLQSAPHQGVWCNGDQTWVWLRSLFESAHFLPNVPTGHKCGRLHGHGFEVTLFADADKHSQADLQRHWLPIHQQLHQTLLNDIDGLDNPTSERLSEWIWQAMRPTCAIRIVHVKETSTAGCAFDGEQHQIWKQQDAECALYIPSQTNPIGHSYQLRLHITSSLDEVMGWAMDYGDVKAIFKPFYEQIDHYCLSELLDEQYSNSETLVYWMSEHLGAHIADLSHVSVFESNERGIVLDRMLDRVGNKGLHSIPYLVLG